MTLAPYDAVLVVSYGGPDGPDDVLPFMRHATAGKNIPDARLVEVSGHYQRFGGVSPINARNAELLAALRAELATRGVDIPVAIGNRNWHPFIAETLSDLSSHGIRSPLVLLTSAYASYSGCRQYREDIARAQAEVGTRLEFAKLPPYYALPGFIRGNTDALAVALSELPGAHVVFVTHSIPMDMNTASGPGDGSLRYTAQHRDVADRVLAELDTRGIDYAGGELAYCSRSGSPRTPWLEPDINDHLETLANDGVAAVVVAPIGFVSDHMEVVFDLDTQARETAARLGLAYVRAATVGTHPAFVADLADALLERGAQARGERPGGQWPSACSRDCCLAAPGMATADSVCSA